MDAAEVVVHVVKSDRGNVVSIFLENALVSRVKRRICILIVRFCRSSAAGS